MSKSRNKYYDYEDDGMDYEENPYRRKSEYLEKRRMKRMQKALKTKDIDSLLEQDADYIDDEEEYMSNYKNRDDEL